MASSTQVNAETIEAARRGDRQAVADLVDAHYDRMFGFALKYCGNREDAEDVTQQACIKLARFIGQYRAESAFTSWLYRLVINCAKDQFKQRSPSVAILAGDGPHPMVDPEGERLVLLEQVLRDIDAMGDGFREAVTLVIGEGLSHKEAALILAVKESTISWRIHEVRRRLATFMKSEDRQ